MNTPDWSRAQWRKSSHSGGNGGCVSVARIDGVTAVRDSKDPDGPKLVFEPRKMRDLLDDVKAGKYEL